MTNNDIRYQVDHLFVNLVLKKATVFHYTLELIIMMLPSVSSPPHDLKEVISNDKVMEVCLFANTN